MAPQKELLNILKLKGRLHIITCKKTENILKLQKLFDIGHQNSLMLCDRSAVRACNHTAQNRISCLQSQNKTFYDKENVCYSATIIKVGDLMNAKKVFSLRNLLRSADDNDSSVWRRNESMVRLNFHSLIISSCIIKFLKTI